MFIGMAERRTVTQLFPGHWLAKGKKEEEEEEDDWLSCSCGVHVKVEGVKGAGGMS